MGFTNFLTPVIAKARKKIYILVRVIAKKLDSNKILDEIIGKIKENSGNQKTKQKQRKLNQRKKAAITNMLDKISN